MRLQIYVLIISRDNEYILSGYRSVFERSHSRQGLTDYERRAVSDSYRRSLDSIFGIHNETGQKMPDHFGCVSNLSGVANIFSHLIGSALFFGLPIPVYSALQPRYPSASTADVVVFSTFFFGVAICFALSAT
jgi:adiponectin receptor